MTNADSPIPAPARGLPWIRRRPRLHRNINRVVVGTLVAFALGQIVLRSFEFPMGTSLVRFVTYGMVAYVTIMGLMWLVYCSRFSRRFVWTVTTAAIGSIVLAASMIRNVHSDGTNWMTVEWRWQPTADERLEEYQKRQAAQSASVAESDSTSAVAPEDMPTYRGAGGLGVVTGPPLCDEWTAKPPVVEWKHAVGGGYAQPVVVGHRLVTIEQRREAEVVACYDAETGIERWTQSSPGKFDEFLGGVGPRATPVIHDGRIYALGALGRLTCLDLATGREFWSRELLKELGLSNQEWGVTSSPVVDGDRLIVNIGGYYGGGLIAVQLADGKDVWKSEGVTAFKDHPPKAAAIQLAKDGVVDPPGDGEHAPAKTGAGRNRAGYATPMIVTLGGVRQILNLDGVGLWGHDPSDGRILWFYHFENGPGVNAAQPIILPEDRILVSASYGVGSRLLKLEKTGDEWSVKRLWEDKKSLESKMSSPALIDGYVYGFDEGFFACIDPETGKAKWKGSREAKSRGKYGHGQMLVSNGLIVVLSEAGDVVLIRPQPDKLVELGMFHVLDGEKTWNPPALVKGKLYIRNHYEMACVDLTGNGAAKQTAETAP